MLTVSRKTFPLGWIYQLWERLTGGNKPDYTENLCHFVRVIVFWTWWHFFWRQRIFNTWVRIWMVVFGGFGLALIILGPAFFIELGVKIVIGLLIMTIFVGIFYIISFLYESFPPVEWFLSKQLFWIIQPWMIAVILFQIAAFFIARNTGNDTLGISFVLILFIEAICLAFAILVGITNFFKWIYKKYQNSELSDGVSSIVQVFIEYIKARKAKICPPIKVV